MKLLGKQRVLLLLIGLTLLPLFHLGAVDDQSQEQLDRITLGENDLPDGFHIDSEFTPEAPEDAELEESSGRIYLQTVREGAHIVLTVNLYLFPTEALAISFFEEMMEGDGSIQELDVGDMAFGKSKEQPSEYRQSYGASGIFFRRANVTALLVTAQLDGNAEDGLYLLPDEVLELDGLVSIARILDEKIIEAVGS